MNTTPRTDAAYFRQGATMYDLARESKKLETELAAMQARAEKAEAELAEMSSIAEKWGDDALIYAINAEYWQSRAEKAEAVADKIERHLIDDGWIMRADDEVLDHNCETWWRLDSHPSGKYMIGNKYARCFFVPVRRNGPLPPFDAETKEASK